MGLVPSRSPRVLVVDDEALLCMVIVRMLEHAGYRCDAAADGLEGLERLLAVDYDLVITDLRMPKMNGLELLARARELGRTTPFMLLSGHHDPGEDRHELGFVRVLTKPVLPDVLRGHIEEVLASVVRSG